MVSFRIVTASRMLVAAAAACAALGGACTPLPQRTGVNVSIDADESLRAEIAYVDVEVSSTGAASSGWESRLTRRLRPDSSARAWPLAFALVRERESDRGYLVTASAKGPDDALIAQVQARSEFVTGRTLVLELRFDLACAGRASSCSGSLSCRDGECVDSFVSPEQLMQQVDAGSAQEHGADAGADAQASISPAGCAPGNSCDDCGRDHGGCDPLVDCALRAGKPACAACPDGYLGDGASGCIPALTGLTLGAGSLLPAFAPEQTEYEVVLPLLATDLVLQPTAADGTTLRIEGEALASGASWTTPAPAFGSERLIVISVAAERHTTRSISLRVRHGSDASAFIKASDPGANDEFSRAVAVYGDTLVVGAQFEDGGAQASDDMTTDAGAVYVFVRDAAGTWRQQAYLKSDAPQQSAQFGNSLALERDRLVVGARTEAAVGAVHVFERDSGAWTHVAVLRPDDANGSTPEFGCAVALQGERIAVGACGHDATNTDSGAVYVFERGPSGWLRSALLKTKNSGPADWFGSSVQLSGDLLVSGATGEAIGSSISGVVHVYRAADGGKWNELNMLAPQSMANGSFYGTGLAVDGDVIAVGAFNGNLGLTGGTVYIYERGSDGNFSESALLQSSRSARSDYFGVQLALRGDQLVVGASGEVNTDASGSLEQSGAAYLFVRDGHTWREVTRLQSSQPSAGDRFGETVAISGDTLVIGAKGDASSSAGVGAAFTPRTASGSGAVYVYR